MIGIGRTERDCICVPAGEKIGSLHQYRQVCPVFGFLRINLFNMFCSGSETKPGSDGKQDCPKNEQVPVALHFERNTDYG